MTVRGVGIHVYSITRTAGHGYVRLTGYEDFTGGMVEVGNRIILPIADNMLITAPAGIYRSNFVQGSVDCQQDSDSAAGSDGNR